MALIICPECGKEVSDKATVCIHCGYPLAEMAKTTSEAEEQISESMDNNLESDNETTQDVNNSPDSEQGMTYALEICSCGPNKVKCAEAMRNENNTLKLNYRDAKHFLGKVKRGTVDPIFNVNKDINVLNKIKDEMEALGCTLKIISISDDEAQKYIAPPTADEIHQAGQEAMERYYRSQQASAGATTMQSFDTNVPRCPTCGSTNVSRIGLVNRAVSTTAWGLASKKINKTYICNDCKYTW